MAATTRTSTSIDVGRTDALHLSVLQHSQELGLRLLRQVADLVEKEGASVGDFEFPGLAGNRPGERALLVPEQLALDQRFGQRRTVDGHKWIRSPGCSARG